MYSVSPAGQSNCPEDPDTSDTLMPDPTHIKKSPPVKRFNAGNYTPPIAHLQPYGNKAIPSIMRITPAGLPIQS